MKADAVNCDDLNGAADDVLDFLYAVAQLIVGLNDILPLHQKHSANREKCTCESCDTLFICATKENIDEVIVKELIKDMIDSQVWNHYINR